MNIVFAVAPAAAAECSATLTLGDLTFTVWMNGNGCTCVTLDGTIARQLFSANGGTFLLQYDRTGQLLKLGNYLCKLPYELTLPEEVEITTTGSVRIDAMTIVGARLGTGNPIDCSGVTALTCTCYTISHIPCAGVITTMCGVQFTGSWSVEGGGSSTVLLTNGGSASLLPDETFVGYGVHAPYREVISLDADCYPAYNPVEFLETKEYARVGAAFWPDQGKLEPGQWERFGLPYHDEPAWESGQFIVDKAPHWPALALADWLNDHSDYVYRHIYGDKDTFHLAWRKLGHEVCIPTTEPGWESVAFVQKDFGGRPLFIHRTRDKFRWVGAIDGMDVSRHYMTEQWHPVNAYIAGLPHEEEAHAFCRESSELLRPELHFVYRPNTCDRGIFIEVVLQNEYRLPPHFEPDDVIVDVGGHIGAFAYACLIRGAGKVITCEPEPGNVELLRKNVARFGDRVEVIPAAVWPNNEPAPGLAPPVNPYDTCQFSMVFRDGGVPVPTVTLDEVLNRACGPVRLLKLDCEGAEYAILGHSRLDGIREICGESHDTDHDGKHFGIAEVLHQLSTHGPTTHFKNGPMTHLWWTRAG